MTKSYKTDGNNHVIFSEDMKLAELIDADCNLLSVLLRFDMELPFGDVSVAEMCHSYGVSPSLFLMICQICTLPDYRPDYKELKAAEDIANLIKYLRASHRYYTQTLLPRIVTGVNNMLHECEDKQRNLLSKFCADYVNEVRAHLEYEEREIFPYIEALMRGERCGSEIGVYMNSHTDVCEKIDDMKSIMIKYLPVACPMHKRCELLFDIFALREDLARHTMLEIEVLAPLVKREEGV